MFYYFRMAGHIDLSERIIECTYEVSDRLTYHICSRKPSHRDNEHLIISDLISSLDKNELALEGRNKLQMVCENLRTLFVDCLSNLYILYS
jgi:hypothetical protein